MTKFKQYYQQMWDANKEPLAKFMDIHDRYQKDRYTNQTEFNTVGKQVREIMEDWDQRLCKQMEKGSNGVFSSKVSEKFWTEVKKDFPLIELVGVEILRPSK
jgi:hypothetical protein